jgi:uncharacterized membrane protein
MKPLSNPVRTFVTGLLALLPLAATLLLLVWVFQFVAQYLGPGSTIGGWLTGIGLGVTESKFLGYLIGVLLVIVAVFVFGVLVETGLQRGAARFFNNVILRIPVVRTIYDVAQKLVGLFARGGDGEVKSMAPVWVYFGGRGDVASVTKDATASVSKDATASTLTHDAPGATAALAFLSTPKPVMIGGKPYLGVLIPTAPVPVGGGLLYVPPHWVEPAEMGMEGVTSIYVSMGVTSEQYLPVKPPSA